jgi:hypothetical protein
LYVAALILLPDRFEDAKPLRDVVTDRHRMPLVIVIGIIVAAAIAGSFGTWFVFGGFGWGFVLIALGIVLWAVPNLSFRKSQQEPAVGGLTASTPSTASTASTFATTPQRTTTPQWTTPQATTRQESVDVDHGVSRVATERRRRFPIGAVAFLVATTVAIFASIGDLLNWWDTNVFAVTLTVLIILAVGMIASVAINQFWLAAPFALLFIGMIVFLLVARPNLNGGIGEHLVTPVTATEASRHQQLAMGRITLDLTEVPLAGQSIATSAEVGLGELHVRVPDTAELRLDTRIGAGVLTLDTKNLTRGIRQEDQRTVEPAATGATGESEHGTITLHLEVGAGSIRIERVHS